MSDPHSAEPTPDQPTVPYPSATPLTAPPYATPAYPAPSAAPGGYPGAPAYSPPTPQTSGAAAYGAAPVYGAPPAGAPGYAAPAYTAAPAYGYPVPARTNALAIVSLVASIAGLTLIPLIGSIVGVITGHMALSQVKSSGEQGRGMALAGTIMGWVGLGFILLAIVFFIIMIAAFATTYPQYGSV